MRPSFLFFKMAVTLTAVSCLPFNHMKRSFDSDADELTNELSKLKTLLQKLEAAKITKSNLTKDLNEYEKNRKDHTGDITDEETAGPRKDVKNVVENEDQDRIINMKKFVDNLTPKELQQLRMLRTIMQEARNAKNEDMVNEGTFAEKEVPESKEADKVNWKDLAKSLEDERDELYLKNTRQEHKPSHVEAETSEGTFGAFKDEIKYAVEKNLLTDVALAIHSGISVNEILSDITGQGKDAWTRNRD